MNICEQLSVADRCSVIVLYLGMVKSQEMRLDGKACLRVKVVIIIINVIVIFILKINLLILILKTSFFETQNFLGVSRLASETSCFLHIHLIQ